MSFFRKTLGEKGEKLAARFLKKLGCRILIKNFKTPFGEIDLVAQEKSGGRIIFTEVKTRSSEAVAIGEQAVNARKQSHIIGAANYFLKVVALPNAPVRFDVIVVTFDAAGDPVIRHTMDAFRPRR